MANELRRTIIRVASAEEQDVLPEVDCAFIHLVLQMAMGTVTLVLAVLHDLIIERLPGGGQRWHVASARIKRPDRTCGCVPATGEIGWMGGSRCSGAASLFTSDIDGERRYLGIPLPITMHRRCREIIPLDSAGAGLRPVRQNEPRKLLHAHARGRGWLKEMLASTTVRVITSCEGRSERMIRMQLSLIFLDAPVGWAALR